MLQKSYGYRSKPMSHYEEMARKADEEVAQRKIKVEQSQRPSFINRVLNRLARNLPVCA